MTARTPPTVRLAEAVGDSHLSSTRDALSAFSEPMPSLVVWPGSPVEVAGVLRVCGETGAAVMVRGTAREPHRRPAGDRPLVGLSTRRLANVLDVDEVSLTVHSQTGILWCHLEEALRRHGMTLGRYPEAIQPSTVGGLLAAPSPVAYTPQHGELADACLGLSAVRPDGTTLEVRAAPRRATGPDLRRLYLGSRGTLGVITSAVLRAHRLPEESEHLVYSLPSLSDGLGAARALLARGARPAALQLVGRELARTAPGDTERCAAAGLVLLSGNGTVIARERRIVHGEMTRVGGIELPQAVTSGWCARQLSSEADDALRAAVGARLSYSTAGRALKRTTALLRTSAEALWVDQFSLQGATLWLRPRSDDSSLLGAGMLEAGLAPLGRPRSALWQDLRRALDPQQLLVATES